jgi:hypothetical protein
MSSRKALDHFDLQVLLWGSNAHAILLGEPLEQVDSLVEQAIPRFSLFVRKGSISKSAPFLEEGCTAILFAKQGGQSSFKAPAKNHRRPRLLFLPSIQIPVPVAARAAKEVADLGVAKNHAFSSLRSVTLAVVHLERHWNILADEKRTAAWINDF